MKYTLNGEIKMMRILSKQKHRKRFPNFKTYKRFGMDKNWDKRFNVSKDFNL